MLEVRALDLLGPFEILGPRGYLRSTEGGTLLLTDIDLLSLDAQEALLGELNEPSVDVRIVTTTRGDLQARVEAGVLREDLLYRLNVLVIDVPPLRERLEDVPAMARGLLDTLSTQSGRAAPALGRDAVTALCDHSWPGNLRELRGVLEATLPRVGRVLRAAELGLQSRTTAAEASPSAQSRALRAVEEHHIRSVLKDVGGNRSHAARVLGINRQTLYNKLTAYQLEREPISR